MTDDIPPFIDLFAFHLAARLFGSERVKEAFTKSHSLRWRSPWKPIRVETSITPHLYFVDVSFYFGRNQKINKAQVEIRFGALLSRQVKSESSKEAIYVQSSPWNLNDLESYTSSTGICVKETGPAGMANIVSSSLANLETAHVLEYYVDSNSGDNPEIKVSIEIEHSILNEGVNLLLHTSQRETDGLVGSVALSMLMQTLTQDDDFKTDLNVHNSESLIDDERNFIHWWGANRCENHELYSSEKDDSFETNTQMNSAAVPLRIESQESKIYDQDKTDQKQECVDNRRDKTNITGDSSSSKTTMTNKRPGVLHGAARNKKRKKGKLTFSQI